MAVSAAGEPEQGRPVPVRLRHHQRCHPHIRYTARQGGDLLRNAALANLKALIKAAQTVGSVRLFSVRHEFPTEWAKFQTLPAGADGRFGLTLKLRDEHYPFWGKGQPKAVKRVDLLARSTQTPLPGAVNLFAPGDNGQVAQAGSLVKDATLGNLLAGTLTAGLPANPTSEVKLFFENRAVSDVWIALTWAAVASLCSCSGLRTVNLRLANKSIVGPALGANTRARGPTLGANGPTLICEGLANTFVGQQSLRTGKV